MITQLVDDQRQCASGLPAQELGVLAREAGQEVVEGGEASVDEGGMLRGGRGAQAVKQLGNEVLGDIVLLDARLDVGDVLDLGVEGSVAAQDGREVDDLLLRELGVRHGRAGKRSVPEASGQSKGSSCVERGAHEGGAAGLRQGAWSVTDGVGSGAGIPRGFYGVRDGTG